MSTHYSEWADTHMTVMVYVSGKHIPAATDHATMEEVIEYYGKKFPDYSPTITSAIEISEELFEYYEDKARTTGSIYIIIGEG